MKILEETNASLKTLKPDPRNANSHGEENLAAIEASLKRFGQIERLVVRKKDRIVFAGNGRLEVLRRLKHKTVRVQYVDGTDAECRAYAVASNNTTRLSKWDDAALLENLKEIREEDLSGLIDSTGFTLDDITDLETSLQAKGGKVDKLPRGKGGSMATCPNCNTTFKLGEAT